ncbi:hypothetical protein GR268_44015, partial [Rhizobium leguminosarum]|nr:hypothetical protein [Rhizobium leguminosarum]
EEKRAQEQAKRKFQETEIQKITKQRKRYGNDSFLHSIAFKEKIFPHIFSFLSFEDLLKTRLVNRDFNEYTKMTLQAHFINTFNLKDINEAIDFRHKSLRRLHPGLIIISGLHKSMKHVKHLPPVFWPYLAETDIQTLDLGNNEIGPIEIKKLAKNLQDTKVEEINLSGNNIGDVGVKKFAKYLYGTNVHTVDLSDNN